MYDKSFKGESFMVFVVCHPTMNISRQIVTSHRCSLLKKEVANNYMNVFP